MTALVTDVHRVGQADLDAWAQLSGDLNPLHNDPAFAATTRFGGTIAHGHLILTWLTGLAGRLTGDPALTGRAITGLRFRAPVRTDRDYRVQAVAGDDGTLLQVVDPADDAVVAQAVLR